MAINHKTTFNLRTAINLAAGIDLPIAGGTGLYMDDAIIITESDHALAVMLEQAIADPACIFYGFWAAEKTMQRLIRHDGRAYDVITYACEDLDSNPREVDLYFDITLALSNIRKDNDDAKTTTDHVAENANESSIFVDKIPHFLGAVHWALSSTWAFPRITPPKKEIDPWSIKIMFKTDELTTGRILSGLNECGALTPSARGLIEAYESERAGQ